MEINLNNAMTNLRELLAKNIKKRRKSLKISQSVVAEKVGTSTHYIGQIEQCKKFPSPEMLERIAAALKFDTPDLFSANSFPIEAIKELQDGVKADIYSIEERFEKFIKSKK